MKKAMAFTSLLMLILISCGKDQFYERFYSFENQSWNKFKLIPFEVQINKTGVSYSFYSIIRYTEAFPGMTLSLNAELVNTGGEQRLRRINIKMKDKNRHLLGEAHNGYHEIRQLLFSDVEFEAAGKCVIEIQNEMSKYETPGLVGLGLFVTHE